MIALEELSVLGIHDDYREIIEELGYLTQLKVLRIMTLTNWNRSFDKSLVWCLNKLHKIQSLQIEVNYGECNLDDWVVVAPQYLRRFVTIQLLVIYTAYVGESLVPCGPLFPLHRSKRAATAGSRNPREVACSL
jgi:hypothetical protein